MYTSDMQNAESQKYRCPKCEARPGEPCFTLDGREAGKVHYGRPVPPADARTARAYARAENTLRTSPLRPSGGSPGIWIGSEFVSRSESVPYGAWYCSCGSAAEALSLEGVLGLQVLYAEHRGCRI